MMAIVTNAVDKATYYDKAVVATEQIYQICPKEMTPMFSTVLQDCSEQVLKDLTATKTQCQAYCNMLAFVHKMYTLLELTKA